jgi:hypothetical protein
LVLLDVLDLGLQLASSGDQQVVNHILRSVDVDHGVLDILFQSHHQCVVLVGADTVVEF